MQNEVNDTHKSGKIKITGETQILEYVEILNPSDLKFRPIVEGSSCPTKRFSKLIDILIQPFLNKIGKKNTSIFKTLYH